MSLQSILKPNNYSLFVNNGALTGFNSNASLLTATGNGSLSGPNIIGGVVASLNTSGNKVITLPSVSSIYNGSGGSGPLYLNPSGFGFECIIVNNTSGYTLTVNSSGGSNDFNLNLSGGVASTTGFVIPWSKPVLMHFFVFTNNSGLIIGDAYPIGV